MSSAWQISGDTVARRMLTMNFFFFSFLAFMQQKKIATFFLLYARPEYQRQSRRPTSPKHFVIHVIHTSIRLSKRWHLRCDENETQRINGEEKWNAVVTHKTQRTSHDTEYTFIEADKYIKSELEIVIAGCVPSHVAYRIPACALPV